MLLDEAEKLYNQMARDFTNKTISETVEIESQSSSFLMLPQSADDEAKQQNHVFQRPTEANRTYTPPSRVPETAAVIRYPLLWK
jgi:hypothetical protein